MDALGDRLARRWVEFGRLLRRNGVQTTAGQMRDLLDVLHAGLIDSADRQDVYFTARALLCSRHEDWPRFDLIFRQFWGRTRQIIIPSDTAAPRPETQSQAAPAGATPPAEPGAALPTIERTVAFDAPDDPGGESLADPAQPDRVLLYSAYERLRETDFAEFTEEERAQARAMLQGWRWEPGTRRTRRLAPARRGRRLDMPRTLRRAMRHGGVPLHLAWRGPRDRPRPLVLICDISGSMAPYTRLLLHFLYTLERGLRHAEVFVFATRLTRITRQLRASAVDVALAEVGHSVVDWSGGTRIGEALRTFNTGWARRVLGQGAVVCIISDGWDRGDPALLAAEIAYLQRVAFRLIWLNPLLGVPGYQPLTRGMAAALRYVDDFLPAHNLRSLESLATLLGAIPPGRPSRKQRAADAAAT
jgi:uncharacterized protein